MRVALALFAAFVAAAALMEEEAGLHDWRRTQVGRVAFATMDSTSRRVIVATRDGVVAGLSRSSGDVVWRKVFRTGDGIDALFPTEGAVITISKGYGRMNSWDTATGLMNWETPLQPLPSLPLPSSQTPDYLETSEELPEELDQASVYFQELDYLIALYNNTITAVGANNGEQAWSVYLSEDSITYQHLALSSSDGKLNVVGTSDSGFVWVAVKASTGEVITKENVAADLKSTSCVATSSEAVCVGNKAGVAYTYGSDAQELTLESDLSTLSKLELISGQIIATLGAKQAILSVSGTTISATQTATCFSANQAAGVMGVVTTNTEEGYSNKVSFGSSLSQAEFSIPKQYGDTTAIFGKSVADSNYVAVVVTADASLFYVKGGEVVWRRDEALTEIAALKFIDLPVKTLDAKVFSESEPALSRFVMRLRVHFEEIKSFVTDVVTQAEERLGLVDEEDDSELTRDAFNQRKLVIALTTRGFLVALDTFGGEVVWQRETVFSGSQIVRPYIVVIRPTTSASPLCAAIAEKDGKTYVYRFNPLTGDMESSSVYDTGLQVATTMTMDGTSGSKKDVTIVAILGADNKVRITPNGIGRLLPPSTSMVLYTVDHKEGSLTGYKMLHADSEFSEVLWTIQFDKSTETIASIGHSVANARINSVGIVLPDGEVLYKYLNPSLLAVATMSNYTRGSATLCVYLIDTLKGSIVEKVIHEGVVGPIHMAQSEHWVIYHYRNRKAKRHEVGVLELFESKQPGAEGFSSHLTPAPMIMRKSYILPAGITAMGVTVTEWGITEKQILLAMSTGHIAALNKKFADARRSFNPKLAQSQGLMRYHPMLPIDNRNIINYHKVVEGIRGIATAPSGLESTSLVLCYGRDLFFTHTWPSKKFDVLNADFNIILLLVSLVAMGIVTYGIARYSNSLAVKESWQ